MSSPIETYISPYVDSQNDVKRQDLVRHVRGTIHIEYLRLWRFEYAWPPKDRNINQQRTISNQRRLIADMLMRARHEGIKPFKYGRHPK